VLLAAGAGQPIVSGSARAESPGRYTLQPIEGGVLRLDTQTGAMALCVKQASGVQCDAVPGKQAGGDEIDRLTAENRQLRADVRRLEELLAADSAPKPPSSPRLELPSEEDVDKALSYMERMLKKFRDKMKEFERGSERGTL
jgi:hypothetical protein